MMLSGIHSLFFSCSPATISRFVIAIVVDSVDGIKWSLAGRSSSGRSTSHVGKKICELFPSLTHPDTATAPVYKLLNVGIRATANHSAPYHVFSANPRMTRISMNKSRAASFHKFSKPATAAFGSRQICSINNFFFSAIAATKPSATVLLIHGVGCA